MASTADDGTIYLAVINRSLTAPQNARINVEGVAAGSRADVLTLAGPAPNAINGTALSKSTAGGGMDNVAVASSEWADSNSEYTFPPSSLTVFRWKR